MVEAVVSSRFWLHVRGDASGTERDRGRRSRTLLADFPMSRALRLGTEGEANHSDSLKCDPTKGI